MTKARIRDLRAGSKFSWNGNTYIVLSETNNTFHIMNIATGYAFDGNKNYELEVALIENVMLIEADWDL